MGKILSYIFIICFLPGILSGSVLTIPIPADTTRQTADSIMKLTHLKAFAERDMGRYENAEKLYKEVVRLKETYAPDDTFRLANVYGNYATILGSIWKYDEALRYYDRALEMADYRNKESIRLLLMNKGSLLLKSNDLISALNYYDQSEKFFLKEKSENLEPLVQLLSNKSSAFFLLNRNPEALNCIDQMESIGILSEIEKYKISLKKFNILYKIKSNQTASLLYNNLVHKKLPEDIRMRLYLDYGSFLYLNLDKIDEAIKMYNFIEQNADENSLTKIDFIQLYNNLGNCYDSKKMYNEALNYYQKALIFSYPKFNNQNILSNPPPASLYEEAQNLTVFKNKAEVLFKNFMILDDTSYLNSSLQNCIRGINIIQKMRYRVTSDQGQFLISKNERSSFNFAQYVALEKYSQTGDDEYMNLAFRVNEKGRAFTLLSAMRSQTAMDFGDVPDLLRKEENDLNRQLSLYDELLFGEKQKADPDQVKISNWEEQLFFANEAYTKLLRKLEREYPEYYRLKYDEDVTDLYDIQEKIDKNTVLVEYAFMDSLLVIYTASKTNISATKVSLEPGFEDKCIDFLNLITTQSFSANVTDTYNKYSQLAYELYSIVFEPIKNIVEGENLIIIPDAAISYLPFDALLTAKVEPDKPDYRHIPYFIKDYSVGYSYSTTIHFNPLQHVKIPSQSILAFAPVYSNAIAKNEDPAPARDKNFLDLVMLPGVTMEVNNISDILKTDAYYNVAAKESVFKEMAGRYNILHLAMHTMVDNNDPMLSRLIFTQVPDGAEDGLLHTYEIYNLKLNASLTVLSSCSSGYGKIQPGEGVQSLARGFAYAGCPSILMTLWEVADLSTVDMMTDFYKYLKLHRTKPQALRESKLDFLSDADQLRSNPFFWASYVVIGDSSPIYPFSPDMAALSAFLLLLPLGFLGIFYKKFKKEEKKRF